MAQTLIEHDRLRRGASIVALSCLGAERAMSHAYRNIGVAQAALERVSRELAYELGPSYGIRAHRPGGLGSRNPTRCLGCLT